MGQFADELIAAIAGGARTEPIFDVPATNGGTPIVTGERD